MAHVLRLVKRPRWFESICRHVNIEVESTAEQPFVPGCDVLLVGPFVKALTEDERREATVTLFGSLLDGGYKRA